jgi:heme/copper-type cytochrome/quinol oxidase subunit 2
VLALLVAVFAGFVVFGETSGTLEEMEEEGSEMAGDIRSAANSMTWLLPVLLIVVVVFIILSLGATTCAFGG